jgi:hypothetical protein
MKSYNIRIWIFCVLETATHITLFINYILQHNWANANINSLLTN